MLWGSFNYHPNLIRIIDYIEILKSYRNILMTFKLILIVYLSHGDTLRTFAKTVSKMDQSY